ncbi:MAG: hypothetical protein A3I77_00540 [Gammaproteobacteria bacterium RIFCSPLOWO2_02_FULL_42_14]|nr:MAG: hypothetical protein A3B71_08625 [Gammaproteobacteria bacterium RIFCSPHIGHO2_02_FULL_42_43]OGT29289.1 MAG: hypothetical protein A2624_04610 [Gammaproteobacteria bacterium RIFCSPHIGHO2_01_FULL_42_8]OGT50771.1 MAG: hypothetical protein A3E54_00820 [Gammaproteobacteria bacterium RIFCSPHIGHO2_12_FULL_41_25]OGT61756.1 MAG: hypothetical protein A3I77_00540 [Gammaproteobacteria bacterium RIFCSPLOWO2_02_FULL_42_14]OGT85500.1 MAG: hypothetical protein A3G86_06730 [Gammaproteobacteria bacterium R
MELTKARDDWKIKAKNRGAVARVLRKELVRIKANRNASLKKIVVLEEKLKSQGAALSIKPDKVTLIHITLSLFLVGRIGFRAISRVLKVLSSKLGIAKAPCAQTISNWVMRLSIVKIQAAIEFEKAGGLVRDITNGYVWMIDLSIGLGAGKILSVLALNLNHHAQLDHAPTLQDVECVAVSVASSWTGDAIAAFLKKVMASVGGALSAYLDADRIASRLSAFCGSFSIEDAKKVIAISVAEQNSAMNCGGSLIKLRRDVLPHVGKLEVLAQQPER